MLDAQLRCFHTRSHGLQSQRYSRFANVLNTLDATQNAHFERTHQTPLKILALNVLDHATQDACFAHARQRPTTPLNLMLALNVLDCDRDAIVLDAAQYA